MRSVPIILLLIFLSYGRNSAAAVTTVPVSDMEVTVKNFPAEPTPGKRINRLQKKLQHFIQKKLSKNLDTQMWEKLHALLSINLEEVTKNVNIERNFV